MNHAGHFITSAGTGVTTFIIPTTGRTGNNTFSRGGLAAGGVFQGHVFNPVPFCLGRCKLGHTGSRKHYCSNGSGNRPEVRVRLHNRNGRICYDLGTLDSKVYIRVLLLNLQFLIFLLFFQGGSIFTVVLGFLYENIVFCFHLVDFGLLNGFHHGRGKTGIVVKVFFSVIHLHLQLFTLVCLFIY